MGGLARTDNSGWGEEFERLTARLLAGIRSGSEESGSQDKKADRV